jgi:hypothetical protein
MSASHTDGEDEEKIESIIIKANNKKKAASNERERME